MLKKNPKNHIPQGTEEENEKVRHLQIQSASREGASAGAHLEGRLGRSSGLVCGILGCFDGVEDVLIGGGRVHSSAHQFIRTGVPLDPGRQPVGAPTARPAYHCARSLGKWRGDLRPWALQLCSKATGNRNPVAGEVRPWALGPPSTLLWRPSPRGKAFTPGRQGRARPGAPLTLPAALPAPARPVHAPRPPPPATLCWRIWTALSLCP